MRRTLALSLLLWLTLYSCKQESGINLEELTVSQIHESYRGGNFTAEELTRAYINRIQQYDKSTVNSIVVVNPQAVEVARALDEEYEETDILRPLHGIPLIVKDNYITEGLTTTGGSVALQNFVPGSNAYQVQKLIDAGAIVLAKSNMAEWAFSPMHTESSVLGTTRNPYDLNRVPAGSSGGTGAAVAANFGTLGLGTDTGNSIRGPSSHNALVGFRSTLGLTSREGIIPLYLRNDVGGPMCRTVEDATRILNIIAGHDPADPLTAQSVGKIPDNYMSYLNKEGLSGAKIGVLRTLTEDIHPEIKSHFEQALKDLDSLGATIVDPLVIPGFDSLRRGQWCNQFAADLEDFLQTYVKDSAVRDINDVIEINGVSEFVAGRLERARNSPGRADEKEFPCENAYSDSRRVAFRLAIEDEMNRLGLDAIVYPSWNYPPALISDFQEGYKGDNSQIISPHTGQPAFTIPMGFTSDGLPTGIQFLGRMFAEPVLIRLTYSYEQGTLHRRPPVLNVDN